MKLLLLLLLLLVGTAHVVKLLATSRTSRVWSLARKDRMFLSATASRPVL